MAICNDSVNTGWYGWLATGQHGLAQFKIMAVWRQGQITTILRTKLPLLLYTRQCRNMCKKCCTSITHYKSRGPYITLHHSLSKLTMTLATEAASTLQFQVVCDTLGGQWACVGNSLWLSQRLLEKDLISDCWASLLSCLGLFENVSVKLGPSLHYQLVVAPSTAVQLSVAVPVYIKKMRTRTSTEEMDGITGRVRTKLNTNGFNCACNSSGRLVQSAAIRPFLIRHWLNRAALPTRVHTPPSVEHHLLQS